MPLEHVEPGLFDHILEKLKAFPLHIHPFEQQPMQAHMHTFIELVYVRKGRGVHRHGPKRYPIAAGDCFIISPGESHGYDEGKNLSIVNILFLPQALAWHINELSEIKGFRHFLAMEPLFRAETSFRYKLHLKPAQNIQVSSLVNQLEQEQKDNAAGSGPLRAALFIQLIVLLSRFFEKNVQKQTEAHVSEEFNAKQAVVEKAIAYLEEKYDTKISVSDIATDVCLSAGHLSHVFKETTGMALTDYLLQIRMDHAHRLLTTTGRSITDISFEVGFHDSGYFTRMFRKHFGASPSQVRKTG